MNSGSRGKPKRLGEAEQAVMDYVWSKGRVSADECREALKKTWPMKESTMRTVLSRLEEKGFLRHTTEGRTYIYQAAEPPAAVAARAVRHIIDRLCGGSAEALVVGMVKNDVLSPRQLERIAERIAQERSPKWKPA
ncbi:MAG TPA: BlaI/MecI/CopY family transcriptional regulator [Vicinamibacterales bacterium]|nr:BlaI/MecI/CopY family transcriptional regulator [Vicinamibacterales bacterium]